MKTIKAPRSSFLRKFATARTSCSYLAAILLCTAWAHAATIHGTTDAAVVWIAGQPSAVSTADTEMRNRDRTFNPPYVVIPVGSSVRFPNDDPFYHSIYSDSKSDPFDIGYYGNGPGKSVAFNSPGIIDVHCHIHASMHATIIVVDGPYALASNGSYTLSNVSPGKLTLHTWSPDTDDKTVAVDVANANSDVTLDLRH